MEFQFSTVAEFLYMEGHGPYVWSSYIVTTIAMATLVAIPYLKKRELLIQLKRQQRIDEKSS